MVAVNIRLSDKDKNIIAKYSLDDDREVLDSYLYLSPQYFSYIETYEDAKSAVECSIFKHRSND